MALENLAQHWCIPHGNTQALLAFTGEAPSILDIGFGMGDSTIQLAQSHRHYRVIGVEVYPPGVGALLSKMQKAGLSNIRVIQHDVIEILQNMVPSNHLAGAHLYFPDPWPKRAQQKRRLVQPAFAHTLASRLACNDEVQGYWHCSTDSECYAHHIVSVLSNEPLLKYNTVTQERIGPLEGLPDHWLMHTKFKARGQQLGHPIWHIRFDRRPPA